MRHNRHLAKLFSDARVFGQRRIRADAKLLEAVGVDGGKGLFDVFGLWFGLFFYHHVLNTWPRHMLVSEQVSAVHQSLVCLNWLRNHRMP